MADGSAPAQSENKAAGAGPPASPFRTEFYSKLVAVLFLAAVLCLLLLEAPWAGETTDASRAQSIEPLAELLFTGYGASFLLLSIVMGAAIVGGLFLAREDPADDEDQKGGGAR